MWLPAPLRNPSPAVKPGLPPPPTKAPRVHDHSLQLTLMPKQIPTASCGAVFCLFLFFCYLLIFRAKARRSALPREAMCSVWSPVRRRWLRCVFPCALSRRPAVTDAPASCPRYSSTVMSTLILLVAAAAWLGVNFRIWFEPSRGEKERESARERHTHTHTHRHTGGERVGGDGDGTRWMRHARSLAAEIHGTQKCR